MRINKIKNAMALGLSTLAMYIAANSSTMCFWKYFEEVEMPKSLYKVD